MLFLSLSCKKEDPLPAVTGDGRNVFACYVDGSVWKHYSKDFKANTLSAQYIQSDKKLKIFASRSGDTTTEKMLIVIQNFPLQIGTYYLDGGGSYAEFIRIEPTLRREYHSGSEHTGKVIITKVDQVNRIVTGTFSFTGGEAKGSEQVEIEDGRFDVIYFIY
ncbi:DUF6252 family protein [uncultured Pontibacter sp.]|uniref:DUF6252 family protein n=1 Tax=uncultured Pontibacter sp. TaxID=453356 RepID=UPI0026321043|nr:DUF6252 family protein [uncultured Pontibacter sp.]